MNKNALSISLLVSALSAIGVQANQNDHQLYAGQNQQLSVDPDFAEKLKDNTDVCDHR